MAIVPGSFSQGQNLNLPIYEDGAIYWADQYADQSVWRPPGKWCDTCMNFLDVWYHCELCGDFDLCQECLEHGRWCPNAEHELIESDIDGVYTGLSIREGCRHRRSFSDPESESKRAVLPRFEYKALPEPAGQTGHIRLLTIAPGEPRNDISATLEAHAVDSLPDFTAISYCWGDAKLNMPVVVNGARFRVTTNLYAALLHLKLSGRSNTKLWIDAICINQSNNEEKAEQVSMMQDIYGLAKETMVWLGPTSKDSGKALALCARMLDRHGWEYFKELFGEELEGTYQQHSKELAIDPNDAGAKRAYLREVIKLWADRGNKVTATEMRETVRKAADWQSDDMRRRERESVIPSVDKFHRHDLSEILYAVPNFDGYHMEEPANQAALEHLVKHMGQATVDAHMPDDSLDKPLAVENRAMRALFRRPWFARVWIVQELVLSRSITFQCGSDVIPGWVFYAGFHVAQKVAKNALADLQTMQQFTTVWDYRRIVCRAEEHHHERHMGRFDLPELLLTLRRRKATDARDKIYALLGLASDQTKELIKIDYNRTVSETYQEVTLALLQATRDLRVLALVPNSAARSQELPSWTPDWRDNSLLGTPAPLRGNPENSVSKPKEYFTAAYTATKGSVLTLTDLPTHLDGILHLSGFVCDVVVELSETLQPDEDKINDIRHICTDNKGMQDMLTRMKDAVLHITSTLETSQQWDQIAHIDDPQEQYPSGEDLNSVYRQVLLTCDDPDGIWCTTDQFEKWRKGRKLRCEKFREFVSMDVSSITSGNSIMSSFQGMRLIAYLGELGAMTKNVGSMPPIHAAMWRKLAKTADGYLAIVPDATELGDQVALLAGGSMPYVVRPIDDDWRLVGAAYVHGIMHGEAWNESSRQPMRFL